jgi:hypothetical protein
MSSRELDANNRSVATGRNVAAPVVAREIGSVASMGALSDLAVRNPAPDGSPVREPVNGYKIFKLF